SVILPHPYTFMQGLMRMLAIILSCVCVCCVRCVHACVGRLAAVVLDTEAQSIVRGKLGDNRFMRVREWLAFTATKRKKVYITPSPMEGGIHNPQPMKRSISLLNFSKP